MSGYEANEDAVSEQYIEYPEGLEGSTFSTLLEVIYVVPSPS